MNRSSPAEHETDRWIIDASGKAGLYLIRKWDNVDMLAAVLLDERDAREGAADAEYIATDLPPLAFDLARRDFPLAFQFGLEGQQAEWWSFEDLMGRWAVGVNRLVVSLEALKQSNAAGPDRLLAWADETAGLADDVALLFGQELAGHMRIIADEISAATNARRDWLTNRLPESDVPHDHRALADLTLSIHLWAYDQVLLEMDACFGRRGVPHQKALADLVAPALDASPNRLAAAAGRRPTGTAETISVKAKKQPKGKPADYGPGSRAWEMRARRVQGIVRPGERDRLVADVLELARTTET